MFIGFGDILGVREFFRHDPLFLKESVESGDGTLITALHELDPENNQSGMGIASAHIPDQFDLFRSMLIWMGMGTSGTVTQGIPRAIIAVFPAINILAVGLIFYGRFGNSISFSVFNK